MELLFLGCQGVTWIVLEVGLHPDYHCTKQEEPIDTTVDFLMKIMCAFIWGCLGCRKQLSRFIG